MHFESQNSEKQWIHHGVICLDRTTFYHPSMKQEDALRDTTTSKEHRKPYGVSYRLKIFESR